jgi:hypothetical protein
VTASKFTPASPPHNRVVTALQKKGHFVAMTGDKNMRRPQKVTSDWLDHRN